MKIFIIDDDEIFVMLTKKTIEATKIPVEISEFGDGEDALIYLTAMLHKGEPLPDMILLDLNMPVMDGWRFLEEYGKLIPAMGKKTPFFVLSSSIAPYEAEKAKNIPAVWEFIVKPLSKEKFLQMVANLN